MRRVFVFLILVLFMCLTPYSPFPLGAFHCVAQEDQLDGFGDDFDDFSDAKPAEPQSEPKAEPEKSKWSLPFDAGGSLSLMTSFNTAHHSPDNGKPDWRGLSAVRSQLKLEFEDKVFDTLRWYVDLKASHDFVYGIRRSDDYTSELTDDRERVLELDKAYAGGRINDYMDLYFGRQIVVWGKSDTIRVVDVINPLDVREPGMTDIDDLRLPLTMTRLDIFYGDWTLKTMAIHEIRFDHLPVWGSDFYPSASPLPGENKPESNFENTEFAASLGRTFNGGDVSLYYAYLFNDDVHLESLTNDSPPQYHPYLDHGRITMLGFDFNQAVGNFILKTELALFLNLKYFNPALVAGGNLVRGDCPEYTRYDGLVGFEYMGFNNTVISFDTVLRFIDDFDTVLENSPLNPNEKEEQWVLRMSRDFKNETLSLELLLSGYGWVAEGGAFGRFKVQYDLTDDISLSGGLLMYQAGDDIPIETIGDNDRVFCEAVYSF